MQFTAPVLALVLLCPALMLALFVKDIRRRHAGNLWQGLLDVGQSPGHRIGHAAATSWALKLGDGYRLPAPTRLAHLLANKLRKEG